LRTITRWDRLRQLVNTLLRALPDFGNVSIFMVILFILFGIFGIQLHSDSFYWRCRLSPTPEYLNNTEDNSTTLVWEKDPA
jgi:voltage-dependent calcium channel